MRSRAAANSLAQLADGLDVVVLDYADAAALTRAAEGCSAAVHLVGIVKESASSTYEAAHVASTRALVAAAAAAGLERVVYLSILGADSAHPNPCFATRGGAEALLRDAATPAIVLRVPMVLGRGDPAALSLERRARSRFVVLLRAASLEQPIWSGDVVDAMVGALGVPAEHATLDLAGPESLPRSELIRRAARLLGTRPHVLSVPIGVGLAAAWLLERLSSTPPVTRAMLGVLDHDDAVDPGPACRKVGVTLTPLDALLERCFKPETEPPSP